MLSRSQRSSTIVSLTPDVRRRQTDNLLRVKRQTHTHKSRKRFAFVRRPYGGEAGDSKYQDTIVIMAVLPSDAVSLRDGFIALLPLLGLSSSHWFVTGLLPGIEWSLSDFSLAFMPRSFVLFMPLDYSHWNEYCQRAELLIRYLTESFFKSSRSYTYTYTVTIRFTFTLAMLATLRRFILFSSLRTPKIPFKEDLQRGCLDVRRTLPIYVRPDCGHITKYKQGRPTPNARART